VPSSRPDPEALAAALGRLLGGTVHDLRRLSGGASRVTSTFELETPQGTRRLVLQMHRGAGGSSNVRTEAALLRAAHAAGVPVPAVVAAGHGAAESDADVSTDDRASTDDDALGTRWIVLGHLDGETIARKILRDPEWATAREVLTAQCGRALAAIHRIDPDAVEGLPPEDPLADPCPWLDALGETRPAIELGTRWLAAHRPPAGPRVTVHGDYRLGNFVVGPDGLRGVLDWELAHGGDAAEDIGWLCAPAWRFGGAGTVAGIGSLETFLAAYRDAGGESVTLERVHWWQVYATVKWATICALQASSHLSGAVRSVEHAAIGRRVCESEWDLFVLLGTPPVGAGVVAADGAGAPDGPVAPFGRPTAGELVEAVREYLDGLRARGEGSAAFEARVAANALGVVERELHLGPALAAAHEARLATLGVTDDGALVAAIRSGAFDDDWRRVAGVLAAAARDQLFVANPGYLPDEAT
jgi:aminoglycoside phosphotransferase (APT) family kinase protein